MHYKVEKLNDKISFHSGSPDNTRLIAKEIIKKTRENFGTEKGVIFLLEGELGSGKTTLIRYLIHEITKKDSYIFSPTFTVVNEYPEKILHIDLYRVDDLTEIMAFLQEKAEESYTVFIEWGEKIRQDIFKKIAKIKIDFGEEDDERRITLELRS